MNTCVNCGNKIGIFEKHKCNDGYICQNCYRRIPGFIRYDLKHYDVYIIRNIHGYFFNTMKYRFDSTASYGNLLVDEINGLIGIKSHDEISIFNALDLKDIDIIATDIFADKNNRVKCNIELRCETDNPPMMFKTYIKKNVFCKSKRVDYEHISWEMPSEIAVIKIVINNALQRAEEKFIKSISNDNLSLHDIEIIKAKALFMIDGEYNISSIKEQRDRLLKTFHPDNDHYIDDKYSKKIIHGFNLLKKELGESNEEN